VKYIILSILVLFSLSAYSQIEDTPLFVGKYFGNQSGGGSGYWQVTGNFTDESGYYDATSIQVGDVLFFVDAGIGYHLPVTSIISASGSSFTIRVNNDGISGVSAVPNGAGGIYRANSPKGIWPFTAGLTASDQQTLNSFLIKRLNSEPVKRDTFITVPHSTNYIPNLVITTPSRFYNNVYISCKGISDTSTVAFLAAPTSSHYGVVYNIKNDSGLVETRVLSDAHSSNTKTSYLLRPGQMAQVRALKDQRQSGAYKWAVNLLWDSTVVSGGGSGITALTGDVTAAGSGTVAATIANDAVTSAKIVDGNVTLAKLATNAVDSTKAANLSPNDLAQTGAATNDVLTWTGSKYAPRPASGGGAPSGTAGGSLDGTYPDPGIATGAVVYNDLAAPVKDSVNGANIKINVTETQTAFSAYFFGTSITAGADASVTSKRYTSLVSAAINATEVNNGSGGQCLQKPSGYGGNSFMNSFSSLILSKTSSRKYLFIAHGENDSYNEYIGGVGFDTIQFKTDYERILDTVFARGWTTADVYIISPFYQSTGRVPLLLQQEYYSAARNIALANGLTFIDVFTQGQTLGTALVDDGVHPTDRGMATAANVIVSVLPNPVKENSKKAAINSNLEVLSLDIRDLDEATAAAQIAAINPDGRIAKFPQDQFARLSAPYSQSGNISILGDFSSKSSNQTGALRAQGSSTFSTGSGLEISYSGGHAFVAALARSGGANGRLHLSGDQVVIGLGAPATSQSFYVGGTMRVTSNVTLNSNLEAGYTAVGVGATVALAGHLRVAAGNATTAAISVASASPLKTSPISGDVEYDGTEYYGTSSTGGRLIFARILKGSATLDFGSTAAGAVTDLTITVTGAADGDVVSLSVPNASQTTTGSFSAWVSATNTVTVRYRIAALVGAEDPASGSFKVTVTK